MLVQVRSNCCQIETGDYLLEHVLIYLPLRKRERETITNTKLASRGELLIYLRRWVTSFLISANKCGWPGWLPHDDLARNLLPVHSACKGVRTCWGWRRAVWTNGNSGKRESLGKENSHQMTDDVHTRRIVHPPTHVTACVFVTANRPLANSTYIHFKRETYGLMSTEKTYGRLPHLSNYAYCSASFSFVF